MLPTNGSHPTWNVTQQEICPNTFVQFLGLFAEIRIIKLSHRIVLMSDPQFGLKHPLSAGGQVYGNVFSIKLRVCREVVMRYFVHVNVTPCMPRICMTMKYFKLYMHAEFCSVNNKPARNK